MLIKNSNKIVLKLGSTTVVDSKGAFKKKVGNISNKRY
jgi:glutamate 5-kinase